MNVSTDLKWFDRIIACGLVGKRTTSLEKEGRGRLEVKAVGAVFAEYVRKELELEAVVKVSEGDILEPKKGEEEDMTGTVE